MQTQGSCDLFSLVCIFEVPYFILSGKNKFRKIYYLFGQNVNFKCQTTLLLLGLRQKGGLEVPPGAPLPQYLKKLLCLEWISGHYSTGNQTWLLFFIVPKHPLNGDSDKNGWFHLVSREKQLYFLSKNMSIDPVIVELWKEEVEKSILENSKLVFWHLIFT